MADALEFALAHHLYVFPLAWGAVVILGLVSNWRAGTFGGWGGPRQPGSGKLVKQPPTGEGRPASSHQPGSRAGQPGTAGELRTQLAQLQGQQESLARQIIALEGERLGAGPASPQAAGSWPAGRRSRKR